MHQYTTIRHKPLYFTQHGLQDVSWDLRRQANAISPHVGHNCERKPPALPIHTKRRWIRYEVRVIGDGYIFREIRDLANDKPINCTADWPKLSARSATTSRTWRLNYLRERSHRVVKYMKWGVEIAQSWDGQSLRPKMVLYNECNPHQEVINAVMNADLKSGPDAVVEIQAEDDSSMIRLQ